MDAVAAPDTGTVSWDSLCLCHGGGANLTIRLPELEHYARALR